MEKEQPLTLFGRFLIKHLRDKTIHQFEKLMHAESKTPALLGLQQELSKFTGEEIALIRKLLLTSVDSGIHDFLFAIQEATDLGEDDIKVMVNGENVAALSDGLHGELFSEAGWILEFSQYPDSL